MLKYLKKSLMFEKSSPHEINTQPLEHFLNTKQHKNYSEHKKQLQKNTNYKMIEGLDNFSQPLDKEIQSTMAELQKMESDFKQTLSDYSTKYKTYMEEVLQFTQREHSKYKNSIILTPEGTGHTNNQHMYYVNNYGVAREIPDLKIDNGKWNNISSQESCNRMLNNIVNVPSGNLQSLELEPGTNLKSTEPCGFEGKNIKVGDKGVLKNLCSIPGTKASQSSNYDAVRFPASNAIDGNPETFNHTLTGVGQWWEVQLKGTYSINKITIQNRLDCCRYRLQKANVSIYNGNSQVYSKQINAISKEQIYFYIQNINVVGDRVRVTQLTDNVPDNNLHMGEVQVWGTEEVNVSNGNVGYVDKNNILHRYPNGNTNNTTGTCPSIVETVTQEIWDSFQQGDEMTKTTLCDLGTVDEERRSELEQLNNQLIEQSKNIYSKIEQARNQINSVDNMERNKEIELNTQIGSFKSLFDEYNKFHKHHDTLKAMMDDNIMMTESNFYSYILWTTIAIVLIMITIRHLRS